VPVFKWSTIADFVVSNDNFIVFSQVFSKGQFYFGTLKCNPQFQPRFVMLKCILPSAHVCTLLGKKYQPQYCSRKTLQSKENRNICSCTSQVNQKHFCKYKDFHSSSATVQWQKWTKTCCICNYSNLPSGGKYLTSTGRNFRRWTWVLLIMFLPYEVSSTCIKVFLRIHHTDTATIRFQNILMSKSN